MPEKQKIRGIRVQIGIHLHTYLNESLCVPPAPDPASKDIQIAERGDASRIRESLNVFESK